MVVVVVEEEVVVVVEEVVVRLVLLPPLGSSSKPQNEASAVGRARRWAESLEASGGPRAGSAPRGMKYCEMRYTRDYGGDSLVEF